MCKLLPIQMGGNTNSESVSQMDSPLLEYLVFEFCEFGSRELSVAPHFRISMHYFIVFNRFHLWTSSILTVFLCPHHCVQLKWRETKREGGKGKEEEKVAAIIIWFVLFEVNIHINYRQIEKKGRGE